MNKYLISVEADRELNYLYKVLMVFTRRRIETTNINTYRVEELKVSRFNIQFFADEHMAMNLSKQIAKQVEVIKADVYLWDDCLHHELGIFSLHKSEKHKKETLEDIAEEHKATLSEKEEVFIIEKVGSREQLDALREELSTHRLLDFGYSGPTGVLNSKVHKKITS